MMLVVSWNIIINKCVAGCRSNYHGEKTVPAFFSTKHEDLKSKRIRFVNDWQLNLTLFVVSITFANFKRSFLKNGKKYRELDW